MTHTAASAAAVTSDLRRALGTDAVVTSDGDVDSFARDWTGVWRGEVIAVVSPRSTAEVAEVVGACGRHGSPLVVQGGNTGLVGGGVPRAGQPAVVLSTRRLSTIRMVAPETGDIVADAGVTLEQLQVAAGEHGWDVGVDFGARSAATVGAMVATNAGGSRVARWGTFGSRTVGAEAVDGRGAIVGTWSLQPLAKSSLGFAWPGALIGSEGTLGVITAARVRCVRPMPAVSAGVGRCRADELPTVLAALRRIRDVDQVEFLARGAWAIADAPPPGIELDDCDVALLVTVAAPDAPACDVATAAVAAVLDLHAVDEGGRRVARLRDSVTAALPRLGLPLKLDVVVPGPELGELLVWIQRWAADRGVRAVLFGHALDGNAHVNVFDVDPERRVDAEREVLGWVVRRGGAVSAEHGVGVAKRRWLSLMMSPDELDLRARLRRAWDPAGIMNPGVG